MNYDELQDSLAKSSANWTARSEPQEQHGLGFVPPMGLETLEAREAFAKARPQAAFRAGAKAGAPLPAAIDWRNYQGKNYVTPVKSQGSCGSCVSFGCCAAVEATYQIEQNNPNSGIDFSEADLFYCAGASMGRHCGNGWWVDPALNAFGMGVVDEACFPYTPGDQACNVCGDASARQGTITSFASTRDISVMKQWLSDGGPLVACFLVYADFDYYESGVYEYVSGEFRGGHCVCIVGYNDEQQCWIAKNSWGPNFGENGYFRIKYGEVGIDAEMWSVNGVVPCRIH